MTDETDTVTVTNDIIEVNIRGYGFKLYRLEEKYDTVLDFLKSLSEK